jgi:hypothetical protein
MHFKWLHFERAVRVILDPTSGDIKGPGCELVSVQLDDLVFVQLSIIALYYKADFPTIFH